MGLGEEGALMRPSIGAFRRRFGAEVGEGAEEGGLLGFGEFGLAMPPIAQFPPYLLHQLIPQASTIVRLRDGETAVIGGGQTAEEFIEPRAVFAVAKPRRRVPVGRERVAGLAAHEP